MSTHGKSEKQQPQNLWVTTLKDLPEFRWLRSCPRIPFEDNIFYFRSELYFRVVSGGWECSHSIRSAILLRYWCPDFFSTSSTTKKSINQKKSSKKIKFFKFSKNQKFSKKKLRFWIFRFLRFFDFSICSNFFWSIEKIFFEEVEKKSEHQYRSKISLRIEWEHSQPLEMVPKPL